MIHGIVAMDNRRGIASEIGIPWDLPSDTSFYKDKIKDKVVAMGRGTYSTHDKPFSNKPNYVLSDKPVREGFVAIQGLTTLLDEPEDVWVIGGEGAFKQLIEHIGKLYITRVDASFDCNKFFPEYKDQFTCLDEGVKQHENNLDFYHEVWKRTTLL